jgi:hypothetical protein
VFFRPRGLLAERQYSAGELHVWNPLESLRSLLIYSVVAPPPALLPDGAAKLVSIQHQPITAGGWPQVALSGLWCAVLALGFVGLWTRRNARQLAFGAGLMLLAQLAVGVLYGEESFLYAASIAPILVYVAAFAYDTKLKWLGLGATAAVVVFGGWNNAHQFMRASELAARAIGDGGNPVWSRYAAGRYILPVPRRTGP